MRAQGAKAAKVSVGRQPYAAGNSPVTQYMMNEKLFEKAASELGYDLTVDWRDYPSALPMVEAFVSGNLDIGMWGNTPIVRLLSQNQGIHVLTVGEGHLRMVLCTRPDSPIRNMEDLKGKTVGALVGGDPYNALSQMLLHELGNADPRAFDIKVVNTPTQAQAASLPSGMDAAIAIYPAFLKANAEIGTKGIVNSFGYTEAGYKGPAGEGAGILLPGVKKSPFFPDGYYLHRSFWICSERILSADAAIGQAFLVALQRAVVALGKMKPGDISEMVSKYWGLSPELGSRSSRTKCCSSAAGSGRRKAMRPQSRRSRTSWSRVVSFRSRSRSTRSSRLSARRLRFFRRPTRQRASCRPSQTSPRRGKGSARPAGLADEQLEGARLRERQSSSQRTTDCSEKKERTNDLRRIYRTRHDGWPDGAERAQRRP